MAVSDLTFNRISLALVLIVDCKRSRLLESSVRHIIGSDQDGSREDEKEWSESAYFVF